MDVPVPEVPARIVFAGGEWTPARARVVERSPAWRRSAALTQLWWWLLAPRRRGRGRGDHREWAGSPAGARGLHR